MDKPIKFIRAGSLLDSEEYLCRTSLSLDDIYAYTTVTFVSYTSCHAIVVVQDMNLGRIRCDRMDLLVSSQNR